MRGDARFTFTLLTLVAVAALMASPNARAADRFWDANGSTAGQTDGGGAWLGANQWWTGSANANWTSGDSATFGVGGAGGAVTLASPTTVDSLTFNYFTGTYTLGTAGQAITLNSGITKNAGAGAATIISPLTLGGAQTWTNNSATSLTSQGGTVLNGALTIDGSGVTNFVTDSAVISGSGGIIKNGTGHLSLSITGTLLHTFTGDIEVNGGSIGFQTSAFLTGRNVNLTNGYLGGRFNSGFTWTSGLGTGANQIQITGGVSGLSGEGSTNSPFQIGTSLSTLVWGASSEGSATGFFNPTVFLANGDARMNTNGKGSLNNGIDLNAANRTITSLQTTDGVANSGFTINGAIINSVGTAGLTKTGVGNLILIANNTYNGATAIQGGNVFAFASNTATNTAAGSLTLSGAAGRLSGTSGLNLSNGGTLRMVSTNAQNAVDRMTSGAITVTNGGGISWENTAGANSFAETIGAATVNSGQFNVNLTTDQTAAGSQTLTLGGLTRNGTSAVTFSAGGTGPQVSGNKNMIVVTGAGSTVTNEIIGPWATTGTAINAQADYAVYNSNYVTSAGIAASAQSSWTTTTSAVSNYTMSALASATLNATRNINSLRSTNNSVTVTASDPNIALASHALAVGDVVTFSATTMPTGLAAGTPYFVVATGVGTIQVSATDGGGAITPTTAGAAVVAAGGIRLSTGNNLGTTGILNGSATVLNILTAGTGAITLPSAGAGQLHVNTGSGSIVNNAPIINNGGALTLVKSGSGGPALGNGNISTAGTMVLNGVNTYTGDTIINAGVLRIGTNGTANGATLGSGNYAGNITIDAGAMLWVSTNANQTLSGVISGEGALMKSYSGTLTLSGNNTYTGRTSISPSTTAGAGILVVSSLNSVVGGTASSSLGAPTTVFNGTIDLGGPGTVQGPATLRYVGTGETTDRVVNVQYGTNTTRTLDASGSGLLRFTSPFTNTGGTPANAVQLIGTGDGQIDHGLPFAVPSLTKSGGGTWTLGGAVGMSTGTLTINGGTLALQKKSSLIGGNTTNWTAAQVIVNSGGTLAVNVGGNGELNNTDVTTLLTNLGGLGGAINNNGLRAGSRIGFDTTNAAGGTFTIADNLANATGTGSGAIGLTKRGTGTLVLTGANVYTGPTTVSAGTLLINGNNSGATGPVTVSLGASLGGDGSIGGDVTINGTLSPGNSPGVLEFDAALILGATSNTFMEIDGVTRETQYDGVDVGTALTYGGALTLDFGTTFGTGNYTFDLFSFASESGNLASITLSGLYSGSLVFDNVGEDEWTLVDGGGNDWTFTQSTGDLVLSVPVPEPGTIALFGAGVALIGLRIARRRKA